MFGERMKTPFACTVHGLCHGFDYGGTEGVRDYLAVGHAFGEVVFDEVFGEVFVFYYEEVEGFGFGHKLVYNLPQLLSPRIVLLLMSNFVGSGLDLLYSVLGIAADVLEDEGLGTGNVLFAVGGVPAANGFNLVEDFVTVASDSRGLKDVKFFDFDILRLRTPCIRGRNKSDVAVKMMILLRLRLDRHSDYDFTADLNSSRLRPRNDAMVWRQLTESGGTNFA